MANNYSEIDALTTGKNSMGFSNTIKRDFGIPLDYSSVQESYEAALNYAKTSTLAYIGQPISVGDTLYVVTDEANGYLKAVGTKPTGDDKSISVDDNGVVSIYGFAAAEGATLPRKKADGTIEWVALDVVVSGARNEKTRVVAADGSDITVTPNYDATNDTYTYTLDVQFPAIPEYTVTKEVGTGKVTYKLTKDGVAVGEAIEVANAYDDTALAGRLDTVEDKVNGFFATVENPDAVIDTLAEIQKYIADDKTGAAGMAASIKENAGAIDVLKGTGDGSVAKAINDAISTQAATDTAKYATKDALAAVSAKADAAAVASEVEAALEGKVDDETLENYYTKTETYTKQEIGTLLDGITGGSQETAASVKRQLDVYKVEMATKLGNVDKKDGEQDVAIQANTKAIAALKGTGEGSVKKTVDDAIAAIPFATALQAGLVKASNEVTVDADGVMGIGKVSTDKLVQGINELVLNGGTAGVAKQ